MRGGFEWVPRWTDRKSPARSSVLETTVVTHQSWRGQFARGTYGNGPRAGQLSDCDPAIGYPQQDCVPVQWPGFNTSAWHEGVAKPGTVGDDKDWMGSLAVDMRDATGQMYMRNRYYDPQTGQFTQPDPIGLAGGLNSYGFAAGDPISYSRSVRAMSKANRKGSCLHIVLYRGPDRMGSSRGQPWLFEQLRSVQVTDVYFRQSGIQDEPSAHKPELHRRRL
jgi:RHS repeat-associated protein